jgi:hypothetical protein
MTRDCVAYDITGEEIHYSKSQEVNIARITLDLDRGIYHKTSISRAAISSCMSAATR